jgi:probable DNA metabolism protein
MAGRESPTSRSGGYSANVSPSWDLDAWRCLARHALRAELPPEAIHWSGDASDSLFAAIAVTDAPLRRVAPIVPQALLSLASAVLCHRDPDRHALLYRLLWRVVREGNLLLDRATDPDVRRAEILAKAVGRDTHKMKAFVRFREVPGEPDTFVAWFEPEHYIVDRVAGFFERRFAGMRWTVLTPYRSVRWDGVARSFGAGGMRGDAPSDDAREDLWRTYYANIFNPARANPSMMQSEMPRRYWKNLPEAALIPGLLDASAGRVQAMAEREAQAPRRRIPVAPPPQPLEGNDVDAIARGVKSCRHCELWQPATQAVPGEGAPEARIMLVGEQPGDREDLGGRPFVGPAGILLDRALRELGIERNELYLTNAVKHFHFEQRGKVRLHKNPLKHHVDSCAHWLRLEIERIRPRIIVCLGATAASAVLGRGFRLMHERGRWHVLDDGTRAMATVHPAWILRIGDAAAREQAYVAWVQDLAALQGEA